MSATLRIGSRTIKLTDAQVVRFHASYTTTSTCWAWQRTLDRDGYGQFHAKTQGRSNLLSAHRVAWMIHHGHPIPDGLTIDHLCRNRACVNPQHMETVTHKVNTLRGYNPCAINARKTHCPQGHRYETAFGKRICKPCRAEATQRWRLTRAG
ncbi:HNH endonuclease signature motif containing protein [Streptomyces sp. CH6]|uniref:HNH endonuclease signature motif containing protein n=1 Tax=Streptomyces sp. CH6 TaxID=3420320 RepID=UPI003D04E8DA